MTIETRRPDTRESKRPNSRYGRAALEGEAERILLERTHTSVFAAACNIGELVAGGQLDEDFSWTELFEVGVEARGDEREVRRILRAGFKRGKQSPRRAPTEGTRPNNPSETQVAVLAWWDAVCSHPWKHRGAPTTIAILGAFAYWAFRIARLEFGLSLRQIAEAAGVSVATVHAHRVHTRHWVRMVRAGDLSGRDSRWRLNRGAVASSTTDTRSESNMPTATSLGVSGVFGNERTLEDPPLSHPSHGYWLKSKASWLVWTYLCSFNDPVSAPELAENLPMSPATVRRHLASLAQDRLAERDESGGWSITGRDAPPFLPPDESRRERHAIHREKFRDWKKAKAAERVGR